MIATYWLEHPEMPDAKDVRERGRYSVRASQFLGGWRLFCWGEPVDPAKAAKLAARKRPIHWEARGWMAAKATAEAGHTVRP